MADLDSVRPQLRRSTRLAATIAFVLVAGMVPTGFVQSAPDTGSIDFSGVEQFWALADTLSADDLPTDDQWHALLSTRAYRYLVEVNRRDRVLRTYLPLAFMPSQRVERERRLKDGTFESRQYLAHFVDALAQRPALDAFATQIRNQHVLAQALSRAGEFLPRGVVENTPPPVVSVAIFEPDAFGDADYGIIVDLLFATRVDLVSLLGHEAHHYYVHQQYPVRQLDRNRDDYALVHALDQLRLEGVADFIDKPDILDASADREELRETRTRYRQLYGESPERLHHIDALLSEVAADPAKLAGNGQKAWELLPNGGHPQGFFMATQIDHQLGRAALVAAVSSPFAFVRAYSRAADERHEPQLCPSFSAAAIEVLNRLERDHLQQGAARP